jgi:hypothetical protein
MPVTIKVNGTINALVHKGSGHFSMATIPDVCKTPSPGGPVPIPYPNISQAATLDKGTTTVKADGGMMIATKGSEFSLSNGDNAGVAGGVKSSTFMKESTWILYSFDVKMDGQNACRFSDKKFQNHENTADLAGTAPVTVPVPDNFEEVLCRFLKECTEKYDEQFPGGKPKKEWCKQPSSDPDCPTKGTERGKKIGECCEKKINDVKKVSKSDFSKTVKAEQWVKVDELGGSCKPDVHAGTPPNCAGVWDFKTSCPPLHPDAPPPDWPIYGDGTNFTRFTKNEGWHGKSQAEVYEKACGSEPVMIHENSEACKS